MACCCCGLVAGCANLRCDDWCLLGLICVRCVGCCAMLRWFVAYRTGVLFCDCVVCWCVIVAFCTCCGWVCYVGYCCVELIMLFYIFTLCLLLRGLWVLFS